MKKTEIIFCQVRGSGLGLSVVKELTVLMGGTITAKSAVGGGTVFTVSFDVEYIKEAKEKISAKPEKSLISLKGYICWMQKIMI